MTHHFLHMQFLNFSSDTCLFVFLSRIDWFYLHEFHFTSFLLYFHMVVLFHLRDAYGWIVGTEGFPSVFGLVVILV